MKQNAPPVPLLSLRGIRKSYPAVVANRDIDLEVHPGQIHAVLGENGAGKSTLMKVIYGATQPDAGEIRWQGERHTIRSPSYARALGVGMVFQHFSLFETLTVAENVSLAIPGSLRALGERIREVGERFALRVSPDTLIHSLSVGERQRVEIIRCILQDPRLLILDEPTSVLPPQGVEALFETLRKLAGTGCAILYISHKLEEVRELCEHATILRDGAVTGTADPRRETAASLAHLMIGREVPETISAAAPVTPTPLLELEGLEYRPDDPFGIALRNVHLSVSGGEVVGIAGVSGNGQSELMRVISGEDLLGADDAASLRLDGRAAGRLGPAERRRMGLNFVPEERLGRGAVPALSLSENALLTGFDAGMSRLGLVRRRAVTTFTERCIAGHDVRCRGHADVAQSLSGGNLQKFIVGRELELGPRLLVVSQPTWGVDVGAAASIRQALVALKQQGCGVLIVSEELEELFEVTDRLYVVYGGCLSPSIVTRDTDILSVGRLMTGFGAARKAH